MARKKFDAQKKQAEIEAAKAAGRKREDDEARWHLGLSVVSDMYEHHTRCNFKDCREAGRCLSYDKAIGVCPIPLDTTRAMMFCGMIWYHDRLREMRRPFRAVPQP